MATLLELRNDALEISDYKNSGFVTDPQCNIWLNDGAKEFYDLLINADDENVVADPITHTMTNASNVIDLGAIEPSFYRLKGLDFQIGNKFITVSSFNFNKRNALEDKVYLSEHRKEYRILGKKIYVMPKLNVSGVYRIWFIPKAPTLSLDTDELDDIHGWDKYVSLYCARLIKIKAEESTQQIDAEMAKIAERINALTLKRDLDNDDCIGDVTIKNTEEWAYF